VASSPSLSANGLALRTDSRLQIQTLHNSAVNQANRMNALHVGCFGFRWHNWYDGHYQWCRSASIDSARSETMVRRQAFFNGQC
jgi:hypothetical protein